MSGFKYIEEHKHMSRAKSALLQFLGEQAEHTKEIAGFFRDSRQIMKVAQEEADNYERMYNEERNRNAALEEFLLDFANAMLDIYDQTPGCEMPLPTAEEDLNEAVNEAVGNRDKRRVSIEIGEGNKIRLVLAGKEGSGGSTGEAKQG